MAEEDERTQAIAEIQQGKELRKQGKVRSGLRRLISLGEITPEEARVYYRLMSRGDFDSIEVPE